MLILDWKCPFRYPANIRSRNYTLVGENVAVDATLQKLYLLSSRCAAYLIYLFSVTVTYLIYQFNVTLTVFGSCRDLVITDSRCQQCSICIVVVYKQPV